MPTRVVPMAVIWRSSTGSIGSMSLSSPIASTGSGYATTSWRRTSARFSPRRLAGFAATVHAVAVEGPPADRSQWYAGEIEAVDAQQAGDVMVVSTCRGSYWGELLATASRARGARGIVADAYTRDIRAIEEMGYPTFVAGINAQDSLGRIDVDELGGTIECGGVKVSHGDLVLADEDGVVVVPAGVAEQVLALAEEKAATENVVRDKLAQGIPVRTVFEEHGVL